VEHVPDTKSKLPVVMSIAGSDSSAGAGIQADLKTFAALKTYGTSAITAITAQNTKGIDSIHTLPPPLVRKQIQVLCDDFSIRWAKTGMLGNAAILEEVLETAESCGLSLVVDPVIAASENTPLVEPHGLEQIRPRLISKSFVITPNLREAAWLSDRGPIHNINDQEAAARAICKAGARAALVTGGHGSGDTITDILCYEDELHVFSLPRLQSAHSHGTGCTLSAALTAFLALGHELPQAAENAVKYTRQALRNPLMLGHGSGPIHHFHEFYGPYVEQAQ
jgi:hydroxymethylpyrimidine kinase/phosphomethylpyrimidine kinase